MKGNYDIKKIELLSDNDLVNSLKENIKKYTSYKITNGILEIFDYSQNLLNDFDNIKEINNETSNEKKIERIYTNIIEKVNMIDILIEPKLNEFIGIDYFRNIRNDISDILKVLNGYSIELAYLRQISKDLLYYRENKITKIIDLNKFYEKIYNFLMEDLDKLYVKLRDIIEVIPFRMSKELFYESIRCSLNKSLSSKNKEFCNNVINKFKEIFNPKFCIGYGQSFDKYFIITYKLSKIDFRNCNNEKLIDIYNETNENIKEINKIINYILKLGIIVNRFIILIKYKKYFKQSKLIVEIKEAFVNDVKDFRKIIFEKKKYYNKKIKQLDNLIKEQKNELIKRKIENKEIDILLKENTIITAYLKDNIIENEEVLINSNIAFVDKEYLCQLVNCLVDFIDRNIKHMSSLERKVRMKKILTLLDIPFKNPNEFFKYLSNSIIENRNEVLLSVIEDINEVIEKYNRKG